MTTKIIEIGKQTYVFCASKLIYIEILPHIFDLPLMVAINQRLLAYPELKEIAKNRFENFDEIIKKQKYYASLFEQNEINIFASVYPIKGKKHAFKEMQKMYRHLKKINNRNFPNIKLLDFDIRDLNYMLIDNTILRDFIPSQQHRAEALIKFMYLFPDLYDLTEKQLIEASAEDIEKKLKENKDEEETEDVS